MWLVSVPFLDGIPALSMTNGRKLYITVYVDDFKMAGTSKNLALAWKAIGTKIKLDPPGSIPGGTDCATQPISVSHSRLRIEIKEGSCVVEETEQPISTL